MSAAAGSRPAVLLPEPDRLWVRYAPRSWSAAPPGEVRWLDLARGELGAGGAPDPPPALELPRGPFDDVLYLPPVDSRRAAARDRAAAAVAAEGTPVLVQLLCAQRAPEIEGVVAVFDLLDPLLAGRPRELGELPAGSAAVWPLLPGLTDDPELQDEGCRLLAGAGVAVVQGVAPALPPPQRRRLLEDLAPGAAGERGEEAFDALFHGPGADPRGLVRTARRHGLGPFLPRPLPRPPLTGAAEREAAGLLALAGEIHLRLGDEARSQACFRAARWIDRSSYDLRALAREGNLPVLHWLDPYGRRIVQEWAETGRSATLQSLLATYT